MERDLTEAERRVLEARAIGQIDGLSHEQHYWLFQSAAWRWTLPELFEVQAVLIEVGFTEGPLSSGGMIIDGG